MVLQGVTKGVLVFTLNPLSESTNSLVNVKFSLSTFESKDGAVIGEHKVTITKMEGGQATSSSAEKAALEGGGIDLAAEMTADEESGGTKSLLPEKYSQSGSTPLKENVTEAGPNSFVFDLVD